MICAVLLTACYDSREIDSLAYPIAMGLDIGKTNNLKLTLQIAVPLATEGGGGESSKDGGGGKSTSIIAVDTPSLYSGLNLINNIISKQLNLSHTKLIVFSKALAQQGFGKYMHAIERGREFRDNIYFAVSEGSAEDFLRNVNPLLEKNPAKFYELLLGSIYTGFFPNVVFRDFYFQQESDSIQPVAILAGVSKYTSSEEFDAGQSTTLRKGNEYVLEGDYKAGGVPVASDGKSEVMGMAVFKGDMMVGETDGAESSYYLLATGKYNYAYWSIPDPRSKGEYVIMNISQRRKPGIKVDFSSGKPAISLKLVLEGDFTSIQSAEDYESENEPIEKATEELIKKEVTKFLNRTTKEFNSDICGFGKVVKGKFLTWDEWKEFKWFDKYGNSTFNVEVDFKVRRTGLMIKSVK